MTYIPADPLADLLRASRRALEALNRWPRPETEALRAELAEALHWAESLVPKPGSLLDRMERFLDKTLPE